MANLRSSRGGAAIGGAASSLSKMIQMWMENKNIQGRQDQQQAEEARRQGVSLRNTNRKDIIDKIAEHPDQFDALNRSGAEMGEDFSALRPPDIELARPLMAQVATAKNPGDIPDIGTLLKSKGAFGVSNPNAEQFGAQIDVSPEQATLQTAKESRIDQLLKQKATDFEDMKKDAYGKSYSTTAGGVDATNVAAPETNRLKAEGEGLSTGAHEDALHTPDRTKARVNEAGATAGAQSAARYPWEKKALDDKAATKPVPMITIDTIDERGNRVKKRVASTIGLTWSPPPTVATQTMMEGAKMIQPKIPILEAQADQLDQAGLFGPVMSRARDLAAKIGDTSSLTTDEQKFAAFGNAINADPAMAQNQAVGKFLTELGLTASGAARVHGGARGGGSPQMYNAFKELLSASGDINLFKGHLEGLNEFMYTYANGPNNISGTPPPLNPTTATPRTTGRGKLNGR